MASFLAIFNPPALCHERLELRKAKSIWISFSFTEEFLILTHVVTVYGYIRSVNDLMAARRAEAIDAESALAVKCAFRNFQFLQDSFARMGF